MPCYSDTTLQEKLATGDTGAKEGRSDESRDEPLDFEQWIERNRSWLTRNDVYTVRKLAHDFREFKKHAA